MATVATRRPLGTRRLVSTGLLLALCACVFAAGFATASSIELYAWDFRWQYLDGARAIVAGAPLYLSPDVVRFEPTPPYVYPPSVAALVTPYTVLPDHAAMVVAIVVSVGAVLGALAVVGVRDPRCYLAVLASAPTWNLLETANATAVLALGLAVAWRYRDAVMPASLAIGVSLAAKLFLWPLVVWAWATRRAAVARGSLVAALGLVAASWALVHFQGLREYPELVARTESFWADDSYSLTGVAVHLGLGRIGAAVLSASVGGMLLVLCWRFGRRGDDRRALTCAVAASIALTPIVWVHYLWLLLVPLGLAFPRFSTIWLVPLAAWLVPRSGHGDGVQPLLPLVIAAVLLVAMLRHGGDDRLASEAALA